MNRKWVIVSVAAVLIIAFLAWLFIESSKPAPGEKFDYNCDNFIDFSQLDNPNISDKCRVHVSEGTKVNYSTNPPVFGPHYSSWITKGFYEEPRPDGNLVHSMEHGYVIIWYNCERKGIGFRGWGIVGTAYAQALGMTQGYEGSASASLESMPEAFRNGSCNNLKDQLKQIYQSNQHKLIVVPRVGMDSPIILTAWNRMEKLNSFDSNKIKAFIDGFRDGGPEATNEP